MPVQYSTRYHKTQNKHARGPVVLWAGSTKFGVLWAQHLICKDDSYGCFSTLHLYSEIERLERFGIEGRHLSTQLSSEMESVQHPRIIIAIFHFCFGPGTLKTSL